MSLKFYKDKNNGIHALASLNEVDVTSLTEVKANTTDATVEKHVPVVHIEGCEVSVVVGEVLHPMTEAHLIDLIVVETDKSVYVRKLLPNEEPKAKFTIGVNETVQNVYEHCNLHGLWVKKIN